MREAVRVYVCMYACIKLVEGGQQIVVRGLWKQTPRQLAGTLCPLHRKRLLRRAWGTIVFLGLLQIVRVVILRQVSVFDERVQFIVTSIHEFEPLTRRHPWAEGQT